MALGDGDSWDETVPVNATLATQIDDYDRDLRKGVRSRMAFEHEWPASQSATAAAGQHKFISLQNQSTQPTLSGTQVSAVYIKTDAGTSYGLYFADKSGSENLIASSGGLNIGAGISIKSTITSTGAILAVSAVIPVDPTIPKTVEGGGKKAFFSYAAVILLVLTMTALAAHLLINAG